MGWVAEGRSCAFGHLEWPYRDVLLESIVGRQTLRMMRFMARHLLPRRYYPLVLVQVALAVLSFYGAFLILAGGWSGYIGNGIGLIALGIASLAVATRGIGRRRPDRPRPPRSPTFDPDDPEVTALPPTSTTLLSERIRLARERQKRAPD